MLLKPYSLDSSSVKCYFYQLRRTCPKHSIFGRKCVRIQFVPLNNILQFRELRGNFPRGIKMKVKYEIFLPPYGRLTQSIIHYL